MITASTLIPFILATFFFIARIVAKSSGLAGGWGWDDFTIIGAFVSYSNSSNPTLKPILIDLQILGVAIYALNCESKLASFEHKYHPIGLTKVSDSLWLWPKYLGCAIRRYHQVLPG